MDPGIIDSSSFGQLWKVAFNFQEQVSRSYYLLLLISAYPVLFSSPDKIEAKQPENFVFAQVFTFAFIESPHLCTKMCYLNMESSTEIHELLLMELVLCQTIDLYTSRGWPSIIVSCIQPKLYQNSECRNWSFVKLKTSPYPILTI